MEQFVNAASRWGLTVKISKMKGMVVGNQESSIDTLPVRHEEGELEWVQDFTYLSSNITRHEEVKNEFKLLITRLTELLNACKKVYRPAVLFVLMYGAETWTIKAGEMKLLTSFHNRCVRTIMGVSRYQQWKDKIKTKRLAAFGKEETLVHVLMKYCL